MNLTRPLQLTVALSLLACGRVEYRVEYRDRTGDRANVETCVEPYVLSDSYNFGAFSMPTVEDGGYLCQVDDGGTSWACVDSTGADAGTVTQGSSTTYQGTFAGTRAMADVTGAKAPLWAIPSGLFDGNVTVMAAGYSTTATNATYQHWLDCGNFYIREEGNNVKGRFGSAGLTANSGPAQNIWNVVTARKNGTSHTMRASGVTGTPNVFTDNLPTGCSMMHFGSSDGAALPLRGPLAWVYFVPRHLSDAEVLAIETAWYGAPAALVSSFSPGCVDNTADSGQVDCLATLAPNINASTGLRAVRAFQNYWSSSPLDLSTGTDIGTPTLTANSSAGPFSRMLNGASECDLMVDDDGAAFEGKQSADAGSATINYTGSYFIKAGTSGTTTTQARITIDTDGTGSTACDVTGLTSAAARYSCPAFIGGSPTYVKSSVLVGNTAGVTGSIQVCQSQLNKGWLEPPTTNDSVVGGSSSYLDISAAAFSGSHGKWELVFTPLYNPNSSSWLTSADVLYLLDLTPNAGGHYGFILFGYTVQGLVHSITSNGLLDATVDLSSISLTPNALYATSLEWNGDGTSCNVTLRLNTCSGSVSDCVATTPIGSASGRCPSEPDRAYLSQRYDGSYHSSVNVAAFRVYQ